ncbi:CAIB/BAIF protein, partial [Pseudomonas amygdali pv. tabaci]
MSLTGVGGWRGQNLVKRLRLSIHRICADHLSIPNKNGRVMNLPLQGIKVVELGQLIAGPFAAKILAEFGAEVIKVEPPLTGDPLRKWRLLHNGTSVWWAVQSRNKQSVTLDLRQPKAQEMARQLIRDADVLVENFRPGTLEGWGLSWEELHALNPKLIMLRVSGYGQTG